MNNQTHAAKVGLGKKVPPTANRVVSLMRGLKAEIEKTRRVTYEMLGRYTEQSQSTALERFYRPHQPQVEGLISLLERVPPQARHQLVDKACRTFPTLSHPRLAYDPVQISRLKTILSQKSGVTIIQGGNAGLRTFVVAALGHQIQLVESGGHTVSGVDVHSPDWFVPVDGVVYLNNVFLPRALKEAALEAWRRVELKVPRNLALFNGIWSIIGSFQARIIEAAKHSHVIIADEVVVGASELTRRFASPIHIIGVSQERDDRIKTVIQPA